MIAPLLQADIEDLIKSKDWDGLRDGVTEIDPPDVAELISEMSPADQALFFRILPGEKASSVFGYLTYDVQRKLLKSLGSETTQAILNDMAPDDRTRLFDRLPANVTRQLIETLSPNELKATRELLGYPTGVVGRYMTPEYVALPPRMTASDAIAYIRAHGRGKETLAILYVVNADGVLMEDVRLGALVLADPGMAVEDIEDRPLVTVNAMTAGADVLSIFERYDRVALPVVDDENHLLGIITHDDVLEFAQKKATEEMQRLGGSEALDRPYFETGFWEMVKKRGGWLAALFLGEMLTATAMGYFEGEIEKAAVVALFVPLIISSGGNSGSQGTSLIIRSLALKEVRLRDWWRVFGREIRTGLALGVFLGVIGFARISLWQGMSHLPHVGSFFQTQAGQLPDGAAPGSGMLNEPVTLNTAVTFPAGTVIARDTAVPPGAQIPSNLLGTQPETTAYGKHWMLIGWTVLFSLIGVIAWGTLAGSMLPFILRRLGFDPATSSAPFVATLVDVTGLIIYFTVASIVLRGTLLK